MLKITYVEIGVHLEQLNQALEEWVGSRVLLALRTRQHLVVEPGSASVLFPIDLARLYSLEIAVQQEQMGAITWTICDAESIEISIGGTWVSSSLNESEGVFVSLLSQQTELMLVRLWQESQSCVSSLG